MNRRSFCTVLAGLPIVGSVAGVFGLPKPTAKSGITVHGPELIEFLGFSKPRRVLSLRFENVPVRENESSREVVARLQPLFGTVNRSDLHWYVDTENDIPCRNTSLARSLMFTDIGATSPENGLCSVLCVFTPALDRRPYPGSHRPVDFETEILKALEGKGRDTDGGHS